MPAAIRGALRRPNMHSEQSFLFAQFARAQTSDDFVRWELVSDELDAAMARTHLHSHALDRTVERLGEDKIVEAFRSLRSADAGAFRAIARTARIVLCIGAASTSSHLFFSERTGRYIKTTEARGATSSPAAALPAGCASKLEVGVRAAGKSLPLERATEVLAALAGGAPTPVWWRKESLTAITTTAVLVFGESRGKIFLKTIWNHDVMYSDWKKQSHARHLRARFRRKAAARQAKAASVERDAEDDVDEEAEMEPGADGPALATFNDWVLDLY